MNPKRAQIVFFWAVLIFFLLLMVGFIVSALHPANTNPMWSYIGITVTALGCLFLACGIDYMEKHL